MKMFFEIHEFEAYLLVVKNYMDLRSDNKVKLKSDFTGLTKMQRSPFYHGIEIWNTITEEIKKKIVVSNLKKRGNYISRTDCL